MSDATRWQTFIWRMERRYECSSTVMRSELDAGRKETAEIARWMATVRRVAAYEETP